MGIRSLPEATSTSAPCTELEITKSRTRLLVIARGHNWFQCECSRLASIGVSDGAEFKYRVKRDGTLVGIGARNWIESGSSAAMNGLTVKASLKSGQVIDIDNRHIVLADLSDSLSINLPQRKTC